MTHLVTQPVLFTLQPTGHILGAASVIVEAEGKRLGFSGDVGRSPAQCRAAKIYYCVAGE